MSKLATVLSTPLVAPTVPVLTLPHHVCVQVDTPRMTVQQHLSAPLLEVNVAPTVAATLLARPIPAPALTDTQAPHVQRHRVLARVMSVALKEPAIQVAPL